MALAKHRQQVTISEDRTILTRVDKAAAELGMSRPELYSCAIRKLLKDPAGTVAEMLADRAAELSELSDKERGQSA